MDKNKKDYLISTLIYQFLFCAILIAVCFLLAKNSNGFFDSFKQNFSEKLENNVLFEDAVESFKAQKVESEEPQSEEYSEKVNEEKTTETQETENSEEAREISEESEAQPKQNIPVNASMSGYAFNKTMQKPVDGEITSEFGFREHPVYGGERFHTGLDIGADEGTAVKAAFSGKVTFAGYDDSFGNFIEISHGSEIKTLYCHLQSLYADENDLVEAGQVIGFVGQTGVATGPHLHFEIRINGVSYDPYIAYVNAVNEI